MLTFTEQETQMIVDALHYYEEVCEEAFEYSVGDEIRETERNLDLVRSALTRLDGTRSRNTPKYNTRY